MEINITKEEDAEEDNEYIVYAIFLWHVADQIHNGMSEDSAVEYVLRTEYADMDGALMKVVFDRHRQIKHAHLGDLTSSVVLSLYLRYKVAATRADWSHSSDNAKKALERIKAEFVRQLSMQ